VTHGRDNAKTNQMMCGNVQNTLVSALLWKTGNSIVPDFSENYFILDNKRTFLNSPSGAANAKWALKMHKATSAMANDFILQSI
jgi:hypothetical protein